MWVTAYKPSFLEYFAYVQVACQIGKSAQAIVTVCTC